MLLHALTWCLPNLTTPPLANFPVLLNPAKPVTIHVDKKYDIKAAYRASPSALYWPLTPERTPHDLLWDDADARRYKYGFMPFYWIFEIRSDDEIVASNCKSSDDQDQGAIIVNDINLASRVDTIEDTMTMHMQLRV